MSEVRLNDMEFIAFHGLYPEENKSGNKFKVNLKVVTSNAFVDEDIDTTIDYVDLFQIVKSEMTITKNLIESVANSILDRIGTEVKLVELAEVTIFKMNPPIEGVVGSSSITMSRNF